MKCSLCNKEFDPNKLRDELSKREAQISRICQQCYDLTFGVTPQEEEDVDHVIEWKGKTLYVRKERYHNNARIALSLVDENGEPQATLTTNVVEIPVRSNEAIIKNYAENTGILESLISFGIVKDTGRRVSFGFIANAPVVEVLI